MLEIRDITKIYNPGTVTEQCLFRGFSLTVPDGQFVSIVGSNGSGKTSLLNIICGSIGIEGGDVLREIHRIVRSNAIVIPLLAVGQGFVAWVGYVIFGVHGTLLWGVLTSFATVIPIVGTALVWVPLALYTGLAGHWGQAVGLLLYGVLVVTQVDNILRMVLQKKLDNTHPLVTIFGVIIGLSLFGFMGVIFGPLLLAMLVFCVDLFKRKYLDRPARRRSARAADGTGLRTSREGL